MSTMLHKQTAKLVARIAENLPEMTGDVMQGWIDNPLALQTALQIGLCPPKEGKEENPILLPLAPATVTLPQDYNPDEFFQTRSGLWVSDDFRRLVVAKAQPSKAGASFKLNRHTLAKKLTDSEIEAVLPANHLFDETQVCAVLASLIAGQEGGQEGTLLNNGYANLFYTASCVVRVDWDADCREWFVRVWSRDDLQWRAGGQVVSLATDN